MSELPIGSYLKKGSRVFLRSMFFMMLGCVPQGDRYLGKSGVHNTPIDCFPAEFKQNFEIAITVHESAKDKIKDLESLCMLNEILAGLTGAVGRNEIIYISKNISYQDFERLVSNNFYMSDIDPRKMYEDITSNSTPVGGFHTKLSTNSSRNVVVVDSLVGTKHENSRGSLEQAFLISNSAEIAHAKPDNLEQLPCGSGDLDDFPVAYTIAIAAYDKHYSVNRKLDDFNNVIPCGGVNYEIELLPDLYESVYDFHLFTQSENTSYLNGLTIFDLTQKTFGIIGS